MRCLGSVTILAGQRVTYYAAKDGTIWKTFDGLALTGAGTFDPQTEPDTIRHIQEWQAVNERANYEQWRHKERPDHTDAAIESTLYAEGMSLTSNLDQ